MDTAAEQGIVFPGIAASDFAEVAKFMVVNSAARRLVGIADELLGYSLVDRCRTAEAEFEECTRIAFLVNCLALAEWAGEKLGMRPSICTGPSFGGTPAAVYSGALSFPDAVRMTATLGHCIDGYFAREHRDVVTQSLARLPGDRLAAIFAEMDGAGAWHEIACHIDHDFHLVSLREDRLPWFLDRVRTLGGLPVYTMRPPMHSALFRPLRDAVEEAVFGELTLADPELPLVSDHDGGIVTTAAGVRELLLDAVTRPVRWPGVVRAMRDRGVRTAFVAGPDRLWGRVAVTTDAFEVVPLTPRLALRPVRAAAGRGSATGSRAS